jgi:ankyrin repeat protein
MLTGDSVLHLAVFENKTQFVRSMLNSDASNGNALFELDEVNLKNEDGNTPLSYACLHGNLDLVKLLHSKGAHMSHRNTAGLTPLLLAIYHTHYFVVHYLLSIESVYESVATALDIYKCLQYSLSSQGGASSSQIFYMLIEVFDSKIEDIFS